MIKNIIEGDVGGGGDEVDGVALGGVETVKEVDDEGAVIAWMVDIGQCISNLLHHHPIVFNRHVSLSQGVERKSKEDGTRRLVRFEVVVDRSPELLRSLVLGHNELED